MKDLGVFTNYNSDSDSSSDSELEEAKYNLSWYDYHHYDLFNYDSLFYAIKCFYCLLKSKIKDNKKLLKQYNNLISKFSFCFTSLVSTTFLSLTNFIRTPQLRHKATSALIAHVNAGLNALFEESIKLLTCPFCFSAP